MIIVALEGPSCAGKTTVLNKLIELLEPTGVGILHFPCYADTLGDDSPKARFDTTQEQLDAFATFMRVELARVDAVHQASPPPDLVILDRSVDTLLAHCNAVDRAKGTASYVNAQHELATLPHLIPDLTIYFDCPSDVIRSRAQHERDSLDEFFSSLSFLRNFPLHFENPSDLIARSMQRVDATQPVTVVSSVIEKMLLLALRNDDATKL